MKITREEAHWVAATLTQQAEKNRALCGDGSVLAPALERVAKALRRGEQIEVGGSR